VGHGVCVCDHDKWEVRNASCVCGLRLCERGAEPENMELIMDNSFNRMQCMGAFACVIVVLLVVSGR